MMLKTNKDEETNKKDIWARQLMQWVINSNRSHLAKLSPQFHISSMGTKHQYILLSAPPAKEKRAAAGSLLFAGRIRKNP